MKQPHLLVTFEWDSPDGYMWNIKTFHQKVEKIVLARLFKSLSIQFNAGVGKHNNGERIYFTCKITGTVIIDDVTKLFSIREALNEAWLSQAVVMQNPRVAHALLHYPIARANNFTFTYQGVDVCS